MIQQLAKLVFRPLSVVGKHMISLVFNSIVHPAYFLPKNPSSRCDRQKTRIKLQLFLRQRLKSGFLRFHQNVIEEESEETEGAGDGRKPVRFRDRRRKN